MGCDISGFQYFVFVRCHKLKQLISVIQKEINVNPLTFYQVATACDSQLPVRKQKLYGACQG